jgi:hypothetical protein
VVGVPLITQVVVLNANPVSVFKFGEIAQLVIAPPVFAGVCVAIAVPLVKIYGLPV